MRNQEKLGVAFIRISQFLSAVNEWGRLQDAADEAFERAQQIKEGFGPLENSLLKKWEEMQK